MPDRLRVMFIQGAAGLASAGLKTMLKSTVFVVDDDPAARESVAALVKSHGYRVEQFESAEEFLRSADPTRPGCLVVDVRMEGMSGLDLQEKLLAEGRTLPVIVITGYADIPMAVRAMRAGAVSFLEKPCRKQELWKNIELALSKERSERELRQRREEIQSRLTLLSEDELLVMGKILDGLPNKRIASELDIGLRTVELRRAKVLKTLHADSLAELVRMAMLVDFQPPEPTSKGKSA